MNRPLSLIPLALVLLTSACRGKIVATAELHGAGTADAHFQSTGAPLVLWADTDGKWNGASGKYAHFPAHYEIDVLSKGAQVGHISCDSQHASESVCGSKTSNGTSHSGDCELKLPCTLPSIPAGDASLHVVATVGKDVGEVKKMSINVRDK
jgi:hypothetical protein